MAAIVAETLTARQVVALEALSAGKSRAAAAVAAGVSRRTIERWLSSGAFIDELRRLEGDALLCLARRLSALGEQAAEALAAGLSAEQPISVRLRAASIVVGVVPALVELVNILPRLEELEQQYAKQGRG